MLGAADRVLMLHPPTKYKNNSTSILASANLDDIHGRTPAQSKNSISNNQQSNISAGLLNMSNNNEESTTSTALVLYKSPNIAYTSNDIVNTCHDSMFIVQLPEAAAATPRVYERTSAQSKNSISNNQQSNISADLLNNNNEESTMSTALVVYKSPNIATIAQIIPPRLRLLPTAQVLESSNVVQSTCTHDAVSGCDDSNNDSLIEEDPTEVQPPKNMNSTDFFTDDSIPNFTDDSIPQLVAKMEEQLDQASESDAHSQSTDGQYPCFYCQVVKSQLELSDKALHKSVNRKNQVEREANKLVSQLKAKLARFEKIKAELAESKKELVSKTAEIAQLRGQLKCVAHSFKELKMDMNAKLNDMAETLAEDENGMTEEEGSVVGCNPVRKLYSESEEDAASISESSSQTPIASLLPDAMPNEHPFDDAGKSKEKSRADACQYKEKMPPPTEGKLDWPMMWAYMKKEGWTEVRGLVEGIDGFVHPDCAGISKLQLKQNFLEGTHWFTGEENVKAYAKKNLGWKTNFQQTPKKRGGR